MKALTIAALGLMIVFSFLTALVMVLTGLGRCIAWYERKFPAPQTPKPLGAGTPVQPAQGSNEDRLKQVAAAAVSTHLHQQSKSQRK